MDYNDLRAIFKEEEEKANKVQDLKKQRLELEEKRHQLKMREFERKERQEAEAYTRRLKDLEKELEEEKKANKLEKIKTGLYVTFYAVVVGIYLYFLSKIF